jgi:hypothetical protein
MSWCNTKNYCLTRDIYGVAAYNENTSLKKELVLIKCLTKALPRKMLRPRCNVSIFAFTLSLSAWTKRAGKKGS